MLLGGQVGPSLAMTTIDDISNAITTALGDAGIAAEASEVVLERPQRAEHGDLSTNIALVVAARSGRAPREVANDLARRLDEAKLSHVESVEVAGPGFVNFRLFASYFHEALAEVVAQG